MDAHLVEALSRWFAANNLRADLCRALAIVPLVLIGLLVVIAWSTPRSNSPKGRSELLLGILAVVGALLLNLALGHLYYRARPFLVLDVHPLLPEASLSVAPLISPNHDPFVDAEKSPSTTSHVDHCSAPGRTRGSRSKRP